MAFPLRYWRLVMKFQIRQPNNVRHTNLKDLRVGVTVAKLIIGKKH
jgi:hypothetical protein